MTPKNLIIIKRLAGLAFGIAFLMGLVIFGRVGTEYISIPTARTIFMVSGGIALFLNLISFQSSKQNTIYSLIYWIGTIVLFVGLLFFMMHWPYSKYIITIGLAISGISFFVSSDSDIQTKKDSELLDDL